MTIVLSECRLCGSKEYRIIDTEQRNGTTYTIARCRACSLVYTRETNAAISPDYVALDEQDLTADHIWLQTVHKEPAFRQCLKIVGEYQGQDRHGIDKPYLLDVGCGVGGWLSFASTAYEGYGFDASDAQARYAASKFPNVRQAVTVADYRTRLDNALPRFDLITLWDVLEHIRTPVEFLSEIAGVLAQEGLVFASVPAAAPMVIKSRLIPFGWPRARFSWNPHEHVVYYSPQTLKQLCEQCNLHVLKIGSVVAYRRRISTFEIIRRCWFDVSRALPTIAPEIWVLARGASNKVLASR